MLALAADTRKAYYQALAAQETTGYMQQVVASAEASAELARRMVAVGNWSKLQQAREQGFYAEAALNQARADQAQTAARERLMRLLGLWGEQTQFTLAAAVARPARRSRGAARRRAHGHGAAPGRAGAHGCSPNSWPRTSG